MIIYNVTIKVTGSIAKDWLQWLREIHIKEVLETGCFSKATILQLLDIDEAEGPTFAIQYFADTKNDYDQYITEFAGTLRQRSFDRWGDQFIAFRSVMEVIN